MTNLNEARAITVLRISEADMVDMPTNYTKRIPSLVQIMIPFLTNFLTIRKQQFLLPPDPFSGVGNQGLGTSLTHSLTSCLVFPLVARILFRSSSKLIKPAGYNNYCTGDVIITSPCIT